MSGALSPSGFSGGSPLISVTPPADSAGVPSVPSWALSLLPFAALIPSSEEVMSIEPPLISTVTPSSPS